MKRGRNYDAPMCDCRTLERLSKEPSMPIEFDAKLNEYHLLGAAGEQVMLYHCFSCGGRVPQSRRSELFMHVTRAETLRLQLLTRDLETVDDVLEAFGPPDFDVPDGFGSTTRDDSAGGPRTTYYRQLTFKGLSDTAHVHA